VKDHRTPFRICVLLFLSVHLLASRPGFAQEATGPSLPPGWITPTPNGFVAEPSLLRKLVATSEATVGDEKQPADGLYVETGNLITGEGWISAGPGYRRRLLDDRLRIDASAAVSWNLYNTVQASIEVPHLAHDRLTLGAQAMHQDDRQIEYFGLGRRSSLSSR
jgi:hypothetical protein